MSDEQPNPLASTSSTGPAANDDLDMLCAEVKAVIVSALQLTVAPTQLGDNDLLFDGAAGIDSVLAVELLLALEDVFGIEIADEELSQDAFSSPRTLAVLVQQAQQRAAASKP